VDGELRRSSADWLRGILTEDEIEGFRRSALERKEHLQARLEALGPDRLEDLERARALLAAIEEELGGVDTAPDSWREWNVYTRILPQELIDHTGDSPRPSVAIFDPAAVLREVLTRLQAEVWAGPEGVSVRGLIEVSASIGQAFKYVGIPAPHPPAGTVRRLPAPPR
jgi:hypothetical protein